MRRGSQVSLTAPVRQGDVPPGRGGKAQGKHTLLGSLSSRRGCRWLTAHRGTGPGRRASCSCRPRPASPWAVPSQGRPRALPKASGGTLCSRELDSVLGSREQAGSPEVPALPLGLRGGREPRQGPHVMWGRLPPAQAAGRHWLCSRSLASSFFLEAWPPRPSGPPPSPLHYPLPRLGFRSAWHARAICRCKHWELHMDKLPWLASLPVRNGRGPHTPAAAGQRVTSPSPSPPPALPWAARPFSRPPACSLPLERIRTK